MPNIATVNPTTNYNGLTGNQPLSLFDASYLAAFNALNNLNTFSNYFVDTGAANAYTAGALPSGLSFTYGDGVVLAIKASTGNNTASTLNAFGSGVKAITRPDGTALQGGEIVTGQIFVVMALGAGWQLLGAPAPTAANGASLALISSQTAAASANINFSGLSSAYDEYLITLERVIPTNNAVTFSMQVGDGGGLKVASYQYHFSYLSSGAATYASNAATADAQFSLFTDLSSTHGCSGEIRLHSFGSAGFWKNVNASLGGVRNTSSQAASVRGDGQYTGGTGALTQVQFAMSAATIASGVFALYGVRKS